MNSDSLVSFIIPFVMGAATGSLGFIYYAFMALERKREQEKKKCDEAIHQAELEAEKRKNQIWAKIEHFEFNWDNVEWTVRRTIPFERFVEELPEHMTKSLQNKPFHRNQGIVEPGSYVMSYHLSINFQKVDVSSD